jgi:hypothetical protein
MKATPHPNTEPTIANRQVSPMTNPGTSRRSAPKAMRIPNSFLRWLTA